MGSMSRLRLVLRDVNRLTHVDGVNLELELKAHVLSRAATHYFTVSVGVYMAVLIYVHPQMHKGLKASLNRCCLSRLPGEVLERRG